MNNWIDKYKQLVYSSYKSNLIATDIDNLFVYEELKVLIEEDGYLVLIAKSDLEVRIIFELQVKGHDGKFLIVAPSEYKPLPDIVKDASCVTIGFKELFPKLDDKALKGLEFNSLCTLSNIRLYDDLGFNSTVIFLLENIYNIDYSSLHSGRSKEKILNALITVFFDHEGINPPVIDFLIDQARFSFPDLISMGLNKVNLLKFLQIQWQNYAKGSQLDIDFKDTFLAKSLGFLFIRGILKPVIVSRDRYETETGALRIGLQYDSTESERVKLQSYITYLEERARDIQDNQDEWFSIIQVLAQAMNIAIDLGIYNDGSGLTDITNKLNTRFQRYIDNVYWSVFSLSGIRRPIVVSRILEYLKAQPEKKKALIVLDGMNYWQWELISKELSSGGIDYTPKVTMAFIPTITAWSRQSIFKGNKPNLTEDNSKEERLFIDYWRNASYQDYQIAYKKFNIDHPLDINDISGDVDVLGIVCNDLDDIMHGSILGNQQLAAVTKQWVGKSNLLNLILSLKEKGFKCFITTDHGNVEAKGIKNLTISEKVGSLSRGQRHIMFSNDLMLNSFLEKNPGLQYGTRDTSIYLTDQSAFTNEQKTIITHGGSHLWEVLIPFIEL